MGNVGGRHIAPNFSDLTKEQFLKLSLRHYLTIAFTMIATVPVLILGLWVEETSMDKELAAVSEKHLLLASNTTAALDRYAKDAMAVFDLFTDPMEITPSPARLTLARKIGFRHISIFDQEGRVTAQLKVEGQPGEYIPVTTFEKLRASQADRETRFSDVMADSMGRPAIYLVKSLASGRIAIGAVNLDYVRQLQSAISFGRKGHSAIVDRSGNIMAHPLSEWQQKLKNIAKVKPVELMMARKTGVTTFFSPAIEKDMITGYSIVPSTGWGVMVPQPLDELEERAGDVKQVALGLIVIGLVVAALISWALAGLLVRPLEAIVKASHKFARGCLDVHIHALPSGYPSEFRELGASFNTMIHDVTRGIIEREDAKRELQITHEQLGRQNERLQSYNMKLKHRVDETAEKNQALLRAVVDAVPGMINAKDLTSRYLFMNNYQARIYGTTPDLAIGKTAGELLSNGYGVKTKNFDQKVINTGKPLKPFEETYADADGNMHTWLTAKTPVKDETGQVIYIVTSAIDITERKKLERMKAEFISTVSHELRTPLTSINGSLGLITHLFAGVLPDEVVGMVDVAQNNTTCLMNLVNDILDIQKLESGQLPFYFRPVNLSYLVKNSIELNNEFAVKYGVKFILGDIEENVTVLVDDNRIAQVLANLLSNAAKFSPRGESVEISLICQDSVARVSVSDNGLGIPEEFHEKIFGRFAQIDASDTRNFGGSGLGLNICKSIVEKHDGEIGFESVVGKGSIFFFTLPGAE